jgi:ligand-binding sensor domain-containing protein
MGKNILKITVLAMIALFVYSCKKESITPTGIALTPASLSIEIGGTDTIKAALSPTNESGIITWSSSNTSIANVNSLGIVTGVAIGSAVITATTANGNKTASCAVTITKWTTYLTTDGHALGIAIDPQGNKWFVTHSGLSKFDGTNWTVYKDTSLANNTVCSLVNDAQGNKWVGTWYGGVSKFDGTNWTTYDTTNSGIACNFVCAIAIDAEGNKWFGTWYGLSKFDGSNWTTYTTANSGLASNYVTAIAIDAQGNKWFGTDYGGVSKFDGTNWTTYTTANSGMLGYYVDAIAFDAQGNKWFGTGGGVSKFDGTNWTTYTAENSGLANNLAHASIDHTKS